MSNESDGWMLKHHDGVIHGPYPLQSLIDAAEVRNIADDSQVMHDKHTGGQWIVASRVRSIAVAMQSIQRATPPPLHNSANDAGEASRPDHDTPEVVIQTATARRARPSTLRFNVPTTFLGACWGLVDFRFNTFVTPWIIRVYWVFAVVVTALSLIFGAASVVTFPFRSVMPGMSSSSNDFPWSQNRRSDPDDSFNSQWKAAEFARVIVRYMVSIVLAMITLMSVRMILEFAIVVFRIAEDVRAVRDQTT